MQAEEEEKAIWDNWWNLAWTSIKTFSQPAPWA